MAATATLTFRVLGPVEVWREGAELTLGGPKPRALLAALLLRPNAPVSTDFLIEAIWGDDVPDRAANAVQVYVSQLRKALGRDRITTAPTGYQLRVESGELDAELYEVARRAAKVAAERGDPGAAARVLREALGLWRGPAYQGLADDPFLRAEAARLDEARLVGIEERIDADLALGAHDSLVGEIEAFLAAHPLRERLWGQLMIALYRSGRQAEALRAYQQVRRTLRDELGIEPSLHLAALEQAVLQQGSGLEWRPQEKGSADLGLPPVLDELHGPLVGRDAEFETARAAWEAARSGRPHTMVITGEPGIGKTRLAAEVTRMAAVDGALVVLGRCDDNLRAPFRPWVQALADLARRTSAEELRALGSAGRELARLVPDLEERLPGLAPAPERDPESARHALFEAVVTMLGAIGAAHPVVVVLEDLQWADTGSLTLLRHVATTDRSLPLFVVATVREPEAGDAPFDELLAAMRRHPGGTVSTLRPLAEADIPELLRSTGHDELAGMPAALRLLARAEGNPLFVLEMARHLAETDDWEGPLPAAVSDVIAERLRHLDEGAMHVVSLAAAIGREFELRVLADVAGVAVDELLDELESVTSARLVKEGDALRGEFVFTHDLVRQALYERLGLGRRAWLHRRVGEAIERVHAGDLDTYVDELAHHFASATAVGEVDRAVAYTARAGALAARRLALDDASAAYRRAIALRSGAPSNGDRCDMLLALGDVERRAGNLHASRVAFSEAAEHARSSDRADALAAAAIGYSAAFEDRIGVPDRTGYDLVLDALVAVGDDDCDTRARLLARLAWEINLANPTELEAAAFAQQREVASVDAVEMARRTGGDALVDVLIVRRSVLAASPDLAERLALIDEVRALVADQDTEHRLVAIALRAIDLFAAGRMADMDAAIAELEELARERQPAALWWRALWRSARALSEGRLADAEAGMLDVLTFATPGQGHAVQGHLIGQMFLIRWLQGRLPEVEAMVEGIDASLTAWQAAVALVLEACGRTEDAAAVFDTLLALDGEDWLHNEGYLTKALLLALLVEPLDRIDKALVLHRHLQPYAGQNALVGSSGAVALGAVDRYLGLLSMAAGHFDVAELDLERAVRLNEAMGAHAWTAHSRYDLARLLLRRARPGDGERARSLLRQAGTAATTMGLGLAPAIEDLLARPN